MTEAETRELLSGMEHATRVMWRWLGDPEAPWGRATTLRVIERFNIHIATLSETVAHEAQTQ